jgi:magnesium-protoporphyrin O-methyltransferase
MECCQCQGIEREFSAEAAENEREAYREDGPADTTQDLIDAILPLGVAGLTLLDIGGGIGAIQHALLKAGAKSSTAVEASSAFARAAEVEANHLGLSAEVTTRHANFVEVADSIAPHDVVTLDRVICCYHDLPGLLGLASARATKLLGLVYPRDSWWTRVASTLGNAYYWVLRNPFRTFVHRDRAVEAVLNGNGLRRTFHKRGWIWQIAVWSRPAD